MTLASYRPLSLYNPHVTLLDNGLTIITEQIPVSAVNLDIWFNVGSRMESDRINGMAHFLEHMIFKGSQKLQCGEFELLLETRGAMTNAATSQEYTHFYFTSSPQDFHDLLPLQIDLLTTPTFPPQELIREKKVVLEEIMRSHDNPRQRVLEEMTNICFPNLPYNRPILGTKEIIENITRDEMIDFHRRWYQPSRMTVVAVGDLPSEELTAIIRSYFEERDNLGLPLENSHYPEASFTDIIKYEYTDNLLQQCRLMMVWRVPGLNNLEKTLALDVLAVILGRGKSSRLVRDLRENRQLVNRISASNMSYKLQGAFYLAAQLSSVNIPETQERILNHLRDIQENGVTETELNRVCQNVANQFIFQSEKPCDRTNLYGYYYSQLKTLTPALEYVDKVKNLTPEDIRQAALKYCPLSAYGVVIARDS